MKIGMLTTQFARVGGVENVVRELSRRLEADHDISLITREREQNTASFDEFFTDVHVIEDTESYTSYLRKGRRFFKEHSEDFDIIHAHNWSPALPLAGLDVPTVLTLHGTTYDVVKDRKGGLRALPYWPIEELALQIPDIVTSITRSHLRPFHTIRPVEIIRNGVDTDRFRPRPEERDELREKWNVDGIGVLIVGSHIERKGHRETLIAASELDQEATVMIPSTGPLTDDLKELAETLDVNTRFYGRVSEGRLEELYSAADVFCLPSTGEGLPLSMLEAMSSGLPILVSDIGDNADIVEESEAGWTIRKDSTDIFHKLQAVEEFEEKGQNAREYAEAKLGWESIVKQYEDVYTRVIS